MAIKTKEQLKLLFQSGDKPTEQDFTDLIDSALNSSVGITVISITNDTYAQSNSRYLCDTSNNKIMICLPESPVVNDYVEVIDSVGNVSSNSIFINPQGRLIDGSFSMRRATANGIVYGFLYVGGTYGWVTYSYKDNLPVLSNTLNTTNGITDVSRSNPVSLSAGGTIENIVASYVTGVLRSIIDTLVPTLTSNTSSPDVTISASHYYGSQLPYKAFDGQAFWTDVYFWGTGVGSGNVSPIWLQAQSHTGAKTMYRYGLFSGGYYEIMPKTWQLLGSNDGISWTTLHSVTDKTTWTSNAWTYFDVNATAAYSYFRLNITATNHPYALNITEVRFEVGNFEELQQNIDYSFDAVTKTITKLSGGTDNIVYDYII